jgi:hypothetical protein
MSSPILKSFTFVPQPKPSSDPLIIKRERMIARLEDQNEPPRVCRRLFGLSYAAMAGCSSMA